MVSQVGMDGIGVMSRGAVAGDRGAVYQWLPRLFLMCRVGHAVFQNGRGGRVCVQLLQGYVPVWGWKWVNC